MNGRDGSMTGMRYLFDYFSVSQPRTVIFSLFKISVRVKQYKDQVLLHLPTACPVKALLATVCKRLHPPNSRVRAMLASP